VSLGLSKRGGLRAGYGAVIAVLVVSVVQAYRIQTSISTQQLEIYRRYVEQETACTTLRRDLWMSGNFIRDFFIRTTPEQAQILRSQLVSLREEADATLNRLAPLSNHSDMLGKLRKSLGEFWAMVEPLPDRMLNRPSDTHWQFLQQEFAPRRGELHNALLNLTGAEQQHLQESEGQFATARRDAARSLLGILAFSVLLSLLVAYKSLKHSDSLEERAERHFAEVERARHELQQLSARLLEIEEEGKRRLSRELHDEIGQTLALLQIELSQLQPLLAAQPELIRERLRRAREMANRTVQTIRNISGLLRPPLLDDLGLVPALQAQLEDFQRRSGIECEFRDDQVADRLPDMVKTCVYRVVQEALHNCEKHSGARKVSVAVRQTAAFVSLKVEDDGLGFLLNSQGMASRGAGLGLLGMRERVSIAGGTLSIDSAPGRGTRIEVQIPIVMSAPAVTSISQGVVA
jgi:signal transduction histidine kinase